MKPQLQRPLLPSEARRLGISWPYSLGLKANPNAGREVILTNSLLPSAAFSEVAISRCYNLGNHVRQVSNAIRFAELNDIQRVYLPIGSMFSEGHVGRVQLICDRSERSIERSVRISGDYFYYEKIGIPLERLERGRIVMDLRSCMPLLRDVKDIPKLGIHLRAGDTFTRDPHPLYMPPPLRFFLDSIERSQASRAEGVHLICQDLNHPYVQPISAYCSEQDIACEASSSSLEEDFKLLSSFQELCLSQGTLALAAAWLSEKCKTIYAFERDASELLTTREVGIHVEHATSRTGLGPWTGEENQMALLSDPSAASLKWQSTDGGLT